MDNHEIIQKVRAGMDTVDGRLVELLQERMTLVDQIAEAKRAENIPIADEAREQQIIEGALKIAKDEYRGEVVTFIRTVMGLSKFRQRKLLFDGVEEVLLPPPRKPQEGNLVVAYQGLPGAWGEQAALKLFPEGELKGMKTFKDVFVAVKDKEVNYGIVPIENSKTGAIGETYDLLGSTVALSWVRPTCRRLIV